MKKHLLFSLFFFNQTHALLKEKVKETILSLKTYNKVHIPIEMIEEIIIRQIMQHINNKDLTDQDLELIKRFLESNQTSAKLILLNITNLDTFDRMLFKLNKSSKFEYLSEDYDLTRHKETLNTLAHITITSWDSSPPITPRPLPAITYPILQNPTMLERILCCSKSRLKWQPQWKSRFSETGAGHHVW